VEDCEAPRETAACSRERGKREEIEERGELGSSDDVDDCVFVVACVLVREGDMCVFERSCSREEVVRSSGGEAEGGEVEMGDCVLNRLKGISVRGHSGDFCELEVNGW